MASFDAGGVAAIGGVRFLGQRWSYWRLLIRGAALLIITLGIYRFWLATDVRRFLWSNTEIAGEALEYTGTALELLLGFLVAIALLIPIYAGFFMAEGAGLSILFGVLLGDFGGGSAVVFAARNVLQSSYSREAEAAADTYGTDLMNKASGDARALPVILDKIGGATEPGMKILMDHQETKARIAAINKLAAPRLSVPFLEVREWAALKQICAGS